MKLAAFRSRKAGFTLVELMVVITVLLILMTMVVGVARYATEKASRSRAEADISAIRAACESYKTDQAVYPVSAESNQLNPSVTDTSVYRPASLELYKAISGDPTGTGRPDPANAKTYIDFKRDRLRFFGGAVSHIRDPWDTELKPSPYGYSTCRAANPTDAASGYNVTYDLWSVANKPANSKAWITNW
ncbi:MAG: hypothetical protein RLZZ244_701 [Verrucomicrobiota bacterium]|jgi:prepilin-type N-terminal cleavage/methylation domain-containing protein